MGILTDKFILLLCAVFLQLRSSLTIYSVILWMIGISCSLALSLWKRNCQYPVVLLFLAVCCYDSVFLAYAPLLTYDYYDQKHRGWLMLFGGCTIFFSFFALEHMVLTLAALSAAVFLKEKQIKHADLMLIYKKQRDASKELSNLLEEKHHDLLVKQDYEIRLATLNERNRIAREIHDNVGHLLSSSLLQVGALQAINRQTQLKEPLSSLQLTLNEAMSSVRSSVHNLYEDALDLHMEIQKLLNEFSFCNATLEYDLTLSLKREVIYQLLAIIREALHNIVKHSNATQVIIHLREHPSFIQLIIEDNGSKQKENTPGIGLHNMQQRVDAYHGHMNINRKRGYQIFITLPKEEIT